MQVTDASGYIFGPKGLQVNGGDGKPKVITGGGGGFPKGTASGVNTYTTTISGVTSYNDGDAYLIRFTTGNTTGATLDINGLGAVPLNRNNDGPIIGGDIEDGSEMLCVYNSTLSAFQLIGTSPNTLMAYVTNADSITITKGQPVYAFGGQGDRITVKLAYNTTDATSAQTVGIVLSASIGVNQKGFIIIYGQIDGLSIFPTSTWSDGDPVYLGPTAGSITNVKPSAPNHLVYLGYVTTANNGSAGRMYVRVQNGYELEELHDVQISGLADNDIIQYDLSTDLWQNKSLSNAGIQPTLVSATNIKTINGNSLVGSGDLSIMPKYLGHSASTGSLSVSTAVTISKALRIPANTLTSDTLLEIQWRLVRIVGNTGQMYTRLYINTSNSMTGATLISGIATINGGGTQYSIKCDKTITCRTNGFSWMNSNSNEFTGVALNGYNLNKAVDQYLLFTVQSATNGETCLVDFFRVLQYA